MALVAMVLSLVTTPPTSTGLSPAASVTPFVIVPVMMRIEGSPAAVCRTSVRQHEGRAPNSTRWGTKRWLGAAVRLQPGGGRRRPPAREKGNDPAARSAVEPP